MEMVCAFTQCYRDDDYEAAHRWMRRAIAAASAILGADSKVVHDLVEVIRQG